MKVCVRCEKSMPGDYCQHCGCLHSKPGTSWVSRVVALLVVAVIVAAFMSFIAWLEYTGILFK